MDWVSQVMQSEDFGLMILPASFLLGLITAVGSSCNLGIVAAVVGFAGSREDSFKKREAVMTAGFFLLGTLASLTGLGLLVGYFGQVATDSFGRWGYLVLGLGAIFFGIISLNLLPFRVPSFGVSRRARPSSLAGAAVFGLVVGAGSVTCTIACCGPLLPVVLSVAAARGEVIWGSVILAMFALGYSLPLAALMLGVGVGRLTSFAQKIVKPIRYVAGVVLITVGFYLLTTM